MKHVIMGTAGHIDHGKTALIKALTGIECDTHKEEKKRGITINLGFAHIDLPSGDTVGVLDVPGHRDFVHTMVAGASGIDFALMVVAADSGVMPQTLEHLQIMQMLGIGSGLIAVTKTDLVDESKCSEVIEQIHTTVEGTFFENCPVIPVSSKTGDGLENLRAAISETASSLTQRRSGQVFRLFIDRIFSVSGFGTVVTGSVLGGVLRKDSDAWLMPAEKKLRVRRLERYGKEVDDVCAGDRASINLAGLQKADFQRGMIISDRPLHSTTRVDAQLTLFKSSRTFDIWNNAVFHLGTYEEQVRIHLLDRNVCRGGDSALVQIHLPVSCCIQPGDRFVLRETNSESTLGGGVIIDHSPLHHRRRPQELIQHLSDISTDQLPGLVASEVRKNIFGVSMSALAGLLNVASDEIHSISVKGILRIQSASGSIFLIEENALHRLENKILEQLAAFHKANPLKNSGRTREELTGLLGMPGTDDNLSFLTAFLDILEKRGAVKKVEHTWLLATHKVSVSPQRQKQIDAVSEVLQGCGMKIPIAADLQTAARKAGVTDKELNQILQHMTDTKQVYKVENYWIHHSIVDRSREKLLGELAAKPQGLTVAQFRDLIGGNRKICLALYTLFDSEGITKRQGDVRVITEKGRALISTCSD